MQNKIINSITAGIIGTGVMTLFMMIAPMMGMPKMSAPQMLSDMLGVPIAVGWIMHFMIGTIFATTYVFYIAHLLRKIDNRVLRGAVFGIIVFVFAQIMMKIMAMMMPPMPATEGSMMLMIVGSLLGHIVFGITVALTAKVVHQYSGNTVTSKIATQ